MRLNFQDSFLLLPSFLNRSTDLVCISRRYNISLYSTSCQGRILHQVTKGWQVFPGFLRCSGQKLKARQIFSHRLHYHKNIALTTKSWTNGLASRRKLTQVFDLRSTCVSFGHPLALSCVDIGRAQIRTQVDASFSPFGHPTEVDTIRSEAIYLCVKFTTFATNCVNLRAVCLPIASPRASSGFENLRRLDSTCESVWPGLVECKPNGPTCKF